ncbi:hypothetical protein GEU84_011630 [Fertoebacter nigrum]|uniref:DUF1833 domain-containing protein n=1 Tax=Fertoeibacter niger TaxID=2656921 RepID=A0A8X8H140_9RHOB|nr:hypothetical protein [Fertoeibacter niger]NUB45040.1 hypothetical protein [Fertoeibacter niger]
MRRVSLNARMMQDAVASEELYVVLFEIEHPDLEAAIRLSTDNAEVVQDEPRIYGTRSSWRGANPGTQPFWWIIASALLPSDMEDAPATATVIIETVDQEMATLLRSFTTPATVHLAVVLASSPSVIEAEYSDLMITTSDIGEEITLTISREEIEQEYYPMGRMTRDHFPGLHL